MACSLLGDSQQSTFESFLWTAAGKLCPGNGACGSTGLRDISLSWILPNTPGIPALGSAFFVSRFWALPLSGLLLSSAENSALLLVPFRSSLLFWKLLQIWNRCKAYHPEMIGKICLKSKLEKAFWVSLFLGHFLPVTRLSASSGSSLLATLMTLVAGSTIFLSKSSCKEKILNLQYWNNTGCSVKSEDKFIQVWYGFHQEL